MKSEKTLYNDCDHHDVMMITLPDFHMHDYSCTARFDFEYEKLEFGRGGLISLITILFQELKALSDENHPILR